jgi:hypothetical protein
MEDHMVGPQMSPSDCNNYMRNNAKSENGRRGKHAYKTVRSYSRQEDIKSPWKRIPYKNSNHDHEQKKNKRQQKVSKDTLWKNATIRNRTHSSEL